MDAQQSFSIQTQPLSPWLIGQSEEADSPVRARAVVPFAYDPRLANPDGNHLSVDLALLIPKPTFGFRAKTDKGFIPAQGSSQPVPEDKAATASLASSVYGKDGGNGPDDDDGFRADDAEEALPEATDAVNPEKLALLLAKESPFSKRGLSKAWGTMPSWLAQHLARQALPRGHYNALKERQDPRASRRLGLKQRGRIFAARQQDPHADKALLRNLRFAFPKPLFDLKPGANLAPRNDPTTKAAAKQGVSVTTRRAADNQLLPWMHQTLARLAEAQQTRMPAPPKECSWRPSIASLLWTKPKA